jgi:hypothetical protein
MSFGNLWVVDSIRHLGADRLIDMLQQSLFLATSFQEGAAEKDIAINLGLTLINV